MTYQEKLRRAFDNIYDHYPMFSSFVMDWKVVESPCGCEDKLQHSAGCPMPYAATDGPNLYLNPGFMDRLNIAETIDVVIHEAGHVFLGHMYRVPFSTLENAQDGHEWNIAFDEALNDTMSSHYEQREDSKIGDILIFPGRRHKTAGDMFVSHPKGKDAEFYHELVKKSRPKQPQQPDGQQGNAPTGDQQGRGTGSTAQQGKPSTGVAEGQPGSGNVKIPTSGAAEPRRSERSDLPKSFGDVRPHPVMESGDQEAIEEAIEEWKQQVAQGINNSRSQGDLPGWLEELANNLYGQRSKQNWRALLRRFMTKVVNHGGQTYDKPHRRLGHLATMAGIILPANRSRQASKGCILVDTSGSMSAEQCNLALSEIEGILRYFPRCEVDLVMADTRLIDKSKQTFRRSDFPIRLPVTWLGRGGTDLCAPILGVGDAARKKDGYKWMVVISDMIWSAQSAINPKIPTIFVWTPTNGETEPYAKATFGTFIGPVVAKEH